MIKINLTQLSSQLRKAKKQGKVFYCFLLIGAEPYLRYEAQRAIHKTIQSETTAQRFEFVVNNTTDWHSIFQCYQSSNLFFRKTVVTLHCDDTILSAPITQKLQKLTASLSNDAVLIISINRLTKLQENSQWLASINEKTAWVYCQTMDTFHLLNWLKQQTERLEMNLDEAAASLLCYYYEGNLLELYQIIKQLKILYPDSRISLNDVEKNINNSAIFSPHHWIDAIFSGNTARTMHIIQQLKNRYDQPLALLRILQKELILLISLKKALMAKSLKKAFDQYKIWQSRRGLFSEILNRLELTHLYAVLHQLTRIELGFKSGDNIAIWQELENLSLLLIDNKMSIILHG